MGLFRNLFAKKPEAVPPKGAAGEGESPPALQTLEGTPALIHGGPLANMGLEPGGLLEGLGKYETSLAALVAALASGGSRAAMNVELQRLVDLDLGRMIFSAPELEKTEGSQIERLRASLERIKAAAEKAGGHLEGGARPPTSLQDVLDSAMRGAAVGADLPPALRVLIPNVLMITTSTLDRIAKLKPAPAESAPPDAGEFDRLAKACYTSLEEWYVRSVMTVSSGSQAEMINLLRRHIDSFAVQAPQLAGETLENIRILDERFRLGGRVIALCREASDQLGRFRQNVNGAEWQQALKKAHDAAEALDSARNKLFGSGFGGVSVSIRP